MKLLEWEVSEKMLEGSGRIRKIRQKSDTGSWMGATGGARIKKRVPPTSRW
ncbi:MAG: hypothetical protein K9K21_12960 [Desulfotignum sp.]|nr:hypothetical protein [Desulfotignum sp.]MCF8139263.1 hypothetical protein [Desulfotignum sp.]